jgi:hypothetical protein
MQSKGTKTGSENANGLNEQQLAVCTQLGIDPASYQKHVATA